LNGFNVTSILLCLLLYSQLSAGVPDSPAGVSASNPDTAESIIPFSYILRDGRIIRTTTEPDSLVPVPGRVSRFYAGRGALYYIFHSTGSDPGRICIGMTRDNGESFEQELPESFDSACVLKIMAEGDAVYILAETREHSDDGKVCLYRINLNTLDIRHSCSIMDFTLVKGRPVLIEKDRAGAFINYNGLCIPVSLSSGLSFRSIVDGRFAVITDGVASELVDLSERKTITVYSDRREYAIPDKYNLKISVVDALPEKCGEGGRDTVFYRILINGIEAGRTETGRADIPSNYKGFCEPGSYYSITIERWVLNQTRKRYERANNIMQPGPVRIFIPPGRIILLELRHGNDGYRISRDLE